MLRNPLNNDHLLNIKTENKTPNPDRMNIIMQPKHGSGQFYSLLLHKHDSCPQELETLYDIARAKETRQIVQQVFFQVRTNIIIWTKNGDHSIKLNKIS